jgi:hypothetical protein
VIRAVVIAALVLAARLAVAWKLSTGAGKAGFDHDRTGFALRGAHVQTGCATCHTGVKIAATCDGCHKDPHRGRMDGQCYECHTAVAWSDVKQLEQHRRTRMPLTGKHAVVDCIQCHKNQAADQFSNTPVDCFACHQADYRATTTHPNHDGTDPAGSGVPFPRECGMCHNPIGWSPAFGVPSSFTGRIARVEHDPYFALTTGSHRAVDCTGCHVDRKRMQAVRCDGCHSDVALRGQHKTRVINEAVSCLSCHPRGARR